MKRLKPTSILTASTLLMLLTIAALLSGCGSGGQKTTSPEAVRIITEASQKKDYIRVVLLADSLENASMTPAKEVGGDLYSFLQKGDLLYFCIDDFSNQLLLLYTDGLNEAENTVQEQFGDEQIVKLLSAMSSSKAQDIIENLKSEVERFRNGAEPNDDLTMMCVRYSPVQSV